MFVPLHNLHLKRYHWKDHSLACGAELNKKTRGITRKDLDALYHGTAEMRS
jgi:hypothetical protein